MWERQRGARRRPPRLSVTGIDYVSALPERGRERAAAKVVGVTRPGGTIALASWTP